MNDRMKDWKTIPRGVFRAGRGFAMVTQARWKARLKKLFKKQRRQFERQVEARRDFGADDPR